VLFNQTVQRRTFLKPAGAPAKCTVYIPPCFTGSINNLTRCDVWPLSRSLSMFICPSEYLIDGQPWKPHSILHAAFFGQQLG